MAAQLEGRIIHREVLQLLPTTAVKKRALRQRQLQTALTQRFQQTLPDHEGEAEQQDRLACIFVTKRLNDRPVGPHLLIKGIGMVTAKEGEPQRTGAAG
ncbi:hypothetical protein D3C76_1334080 [compost metagenome]